MAPTDDEDAPGPAAQEVGTGTAGTEEAAQPRGRVRARPQARAKSPRSRPASTKAAPSEPAAGEVRRPRAREAVAAADEGQKRKIVFLSVITVVVLALAVGAFVIGQGSGSTPRANNQNTTATTTAGPVELGSTPGPTLPDSAFTEFRDDETGFRMKVPTDWPKINVPDRAVRLVALSAQQDGVQVRVTLTDEPTTPDNLKNIKAFTDGGIGQNETVKVLDQKALTVNGLIGYYYLYTFTHAESGLQGVNAHYFLFQGRKMNSILFQALPAERFQDLKGVFDQMLNSFHSDPGVTAPAPETPAPPVTPPPPPS